MTTPAGIFKVSRPNADHVDYDEYESFVVVCRDASAARRTHPRSTQEYINEGWAPRWSESREAWVNSHNEPNSYHSWTTFIDELVVERIGDAADGHIGVVCASFRAG